MIGIRFKDYFIINKDEDTVIIINKNNEAGDFDKKEFEKVIDNYFKENH